MSLSFRGVLGLSASLLLAGCAFLPLPAAAQTKSDQWIHVRVENKDNSGETVRVNVPIEMAEKILSVINHENLHNGKVRIDNAHLDDVDFRALLDAVRSAKDGEYVTVQSNENDVRVAKSGGYLYIHVNEKQLREHAAKHTESGKTETAKESKVEIKAPMKVVDALFSAGKDELDIVAALHALSLNGDTELVTVKDNQDTVHVWIDSKNISD
jgi:hypothetical protein